MVGGRAVPAIMSALAFRWIVATCTALAAVSCSTNGSGGAAKGPPPRQFNAQRTALGTTFRVTVYGSDAATASAAIASAFGRLDQADAALNDRRADSDIARLNNAPDGRPVKVGNDLFNVLQQAVRISAATRGAFDVTAGPHVDLWRAAAATNRAPSQGELENARLHVGWDKVRLDPIEHAVTLTVPGMRLDLSGVARGYAVDQMVIQFRSSGCDRILIDAGDVVFAGAAPPGAAGWPVSLRGAAPKSRQAPIALDRHAIAFGGGARKDPEPPPIDPTSGRIVAGAPPVAVVAPSALRAQCIATAAAVLGPAGLETLSRADRQAKVWFATPKKQ
jgi:FAD:protein FMN transferase